MSNWNEVYREGDAVDVDFDGWKPATVALSSVQDEGPCVSVVFTNDEDLAHIKYTVRDAHGESVEKIGRFHVWDSSLVRKKS